MANDTVCNSYEEARRRRLEDNKKRFEDLGISKISKSLSEFSKPENSPLSQSGPRKQRSYAVYSAEPRRSSRARNLVSSYREDVTVDVEFPSFRKRRSTGGSWASYLARPLEEVRTASYEQRAEALHNAEKVRENLQTSNPTFVKSMVRSHVYSCFWLGLPSAFCERYLPKDTLLNMVLEDEDGDETEAIYIGKRAGLSGGWRGFALSHKLDDGDALVFELVEPARFKIYIVRAGYEQGGKPNAEESVEVEEQESKKPKRLKKEPQQADMVQEQGSKKPKRLKKEAQQADKVEEQESKKPKRLKKEPQQADKVEEESKKPKKVKKEPINSCDEANGGESNTQRLRRSTRSATKTSNN